MNWTHAATVAGQWPPTYSTSECRRFTVFVTPTLQYIGRRFATETDYKPAAESTPGTYDEAVAWCERQAADLKGTE